MDLNFCMEFKCNDIQVKVVGQSHRSKDNVTRSNNGSLGHSIDF